MGWLFVCYVEMSMQQNWYTVCGDLCVMKQYLMVLFISYCWGTQSQFLTMRFLYGQRFWFSDSNLLNSLKDSFRFDHLFIR